MRDEEAIADHEAAKQRVRLEDPADPHRRAAGLGELHRDGRTNREVFAVRGGRIDEQLSRGKGRCTCSGLHAQDDGLGKVDGGDRRQTLE